MVCYSVAMQVYHSKCDLLPGTSYPEVVAAARREYHVIQKRNPRRIPYVRSAYFKKDSRQEKIFISNFWDHLKSKRATDQRRRLRFYVCAIDLLRNAKNEPEVVIGEEPGTLKYRFIGKANNGELFCVQIKQDKKTGRKDFISVFPVKSSK